MPRSEEELLERVLRRSAEIRRRRRNLRATAGLLSVALVVGLGAPLVLRGAVIPRKPGSSVALAPSPAPPGPRTSPRTTPCACALKRPAPPPSAGKSPPAPGEPTPPPPVSSSDRLAFATDRDGNWEIYSMNTDGSQMRRLTNDPRPDREPSWSPDGKHIAFIRLPANSIDIGNLSGDIYIVNADGSNLRYLAHGGNPRWSPDGTMIAFHDQVASTGELAGTINVINADGTGQRTLADVPNALDPAWTPDGKRIVFGGLDTRGITNVGVVSLDGSGSVEITHDPVFACQPDVSPDGRYIAYIASGGSLLHLQVIDIDGDVASITHPTHDPAFALEFSPSWSPDGTLIAVERDPDGDPHYTNVGGILVTGSKPSEIVLVRADGSRETILSGGIYSQADPAFAPRGP
jgi:TolB protein